jgi:hypothetical protein
MSHKTLAKRKRSAIHQNRERPKRSPTDIIFAEVLSRLIARMNPEVGNLSWVSHATIATQVGLGKEAVKFYLKAACLVGAVRVRYTNASTAHQRTQRFFPNYTDHTQGQTFQMLLGSEPDRPRRLNYYTIQGCISWEGFSGKALPDWQIEVIKLCATQKATNVRKAEIISARHRIASGNGRVDPRVSKASEALRNGRVDPRVPFLPKRKGAGVSDPLAQRSREESAEQVRQTEPGGCAAGSNLTKPVASGTSGEGMQVVEETEDSMLSGSLPGISEIAAPDDRPGKPLEGSPLYSELETARHPSSLSRRSPLTRERDDVDDLLDALEAEGVTVVRE